jgi:hypothetical protein
LKFLLRGSAGIALLACLTVEGAPAQEREALAIACAAGPNPEVTFVCQEAVLALEAFRAGVGLSMTQGTDVPGFASTVGRGLGGRPLLTATARIGFSRFEAPDFAGPGRPLPAEGSSFVIPTVQAGFALGVLDGFTTGPATRGILSLDLLGSVAFSVLSKGDGFRENLLTYGFGARVGILKESFTVPGVSLSVMRRQGSEDVSIGLVGDEDRAQVVFAPSVTSLRATIGKDFLPLGLIGGIGFDRYDGDGEVRVLDPLSASREAVASTSDWSSTRPIAYGGVQFTYLVFQTSLELGWAGGFDDAEGYTGDYAPESSAVFANLGVRLTF